MVDPKVTKTAMEGYSFDEMATLLTLEMNIVNMVLVVRKRERKRNKKDEGGSRLEK